MKKYVVFACPFYYPRGGMDDVAGSFDTLEEALSNGPSSILSLSNPGWWEIVDRDTWAILEHGRLDFEP